MTTLPNCSRSSRREHVPWRSIRLARGEGETARHVVGCPLRAQLAKRQAREEEEVKTEMPGRL
jgi:hypothetical protein